MKTIISHTGLAFLAAGVIALIIDWLCPSQEFWIFLSIGLFGVILIVSSHYWNYLAPRIPCERIRQDANPDRYVFPEIVGIDNSVLLMYGKMRDIINANYIYVTVRIKSDLKFNIVFVSLTGYAIINGIETPSPPAILENKNDIKLIKYDISSELSWRLDIQDSSCEAALLNEQRSFIDDVPNTIKLKLNGVDSKSRHYKLETEEFIIGR